MGGSDWCVATHASDLAVALVAAGAEVHVQGPAGERTMLLDTFYREPGSNPHLETSIDHGDLIIAVSMPALPGGGRSVYLKVRERASYEFALVSVAASVALDGGLIGEARVALGGVATRPWRARETEAMLAGVALDDRAAIREAASAAFADAWPCATNAFKIELGTRAIVRALRQAGGAG
jgi:xanthine dehydrogenase YagS FAD-binding subunit